MKLLKDEKIELMRKERCVHPMCVILVFFDKWLQKTNQKVLEDLWGVEEYQNIVVYRILNSNSK